MLLLDGDGLSVSLLGRGTEAGMTETKNGIPLGDRRRTPFYGWVLSPHKLPRGAMDVVDVLQ